MTRPRKKRRATSKQQATSFRMREGTLTSTTVYSGFPDDFDASAYGSILGVSDFLEKAARLTGEVSIVPDTLRADFAAQLKYHISRLRLYLTADAPNTHDVIFHAMYAAMLYHSLIGELRDDKQSKQAGLSRSAYLRNRSLANKRGDLAERCGMSLAALRDWEKKNNMR